MGQVETRITKLVRLCCKSCSLNSKHLTIIAASIGPTVNRTLGPSGPLQKFSFRRFAWQGRLFYIALLARRGRKIVRPAMVHCSRRGPEQRRPISLRQQMHTRFFFFKKKEADPHADAAPLLSTSTWSTIAVADWTMLLLTTSNWRPETGEQVASRRGRFRLLARRHWRTGPVDQWMNGTKTAEKSTGRSEIGPRGLVTDTVPKSKQPELRPCRSETSRSRRPRTRRPYCWLLLWGKKHDVDVENERPLWHDHKVGA